MDEIDALSGRTCIARATHSSQTRGSEFNNRHGWSAMGGVERVERQWWCDGSVAPVRRAARCAVRRAALRVSAPQRKPRYHPEPPKRPTREPR